LPPSNERTLRRVAAALAGATGVGHLVLGAVNVIPGEPTAGPAFAGMGAGYLVFGGLVLLGKTVFDPIALFYTLALILAYAASRDTLPVEPIGLGIKAVEVALLLVLVDLLVRTRRRSRGDPLKTLAGRNISRHEP